MYLDLIRLFIIKKKDKNVLITGFPIINDCSWLIKSSRKVYFWRQPVNVNVMGIEILESLEEIGSSSLDAIIVGPERSVIKGKEMLLQRLLSSAGQVLTYGSIKAFEATFKKDRFIVLPSYTRCCLIVPDQCDKNVLYSSLEWRLTAKLKSRVKHKVFKHLINISLFKSLLPQMTIYYQNGYESLHQAVEKLAPDNSNFAYSPKSFGESASVCIQVMNREGKVSGYIKAALNSSMEGIKNERLLLDKLGRIKFSHMEIPSLQSSLTIDEGDAFYQSGRLCGKYAPMNMVYVKALAELYKKTAVEMRLKDTDIYIYIKNSEFDKKISEVCEEAAEDINKYKEYFLKLGNKTVTACVNHGDFWPYNVKETENNTAYVYDWEDGRLKGLPLLDLMKFIIQHEIFIKKTDAKRAMLLINSKYRKFFNEYIEQTGLSLEFEFCLLAFALSRIAQICEEHGNLTHAEDEAWQMKQLCLIADYCISNLESGRCNNGHGFS